MESNEHTELTNKIEQTQRERAGRQLWKGKLWGGGIEQKSKRTHDYEGRKKKRVGRGGRKYKGDKW